MEQVNSSLVDLIKQVYQPSKGAYGAPRIYADLRAQGYRYGKNHIAKLMKQIGLRGCLKKRYRNFSKEFPSYPFTDNVLSRQFNVYKPNSVWSSDITYVQTRQWFLYLAVVMDLFSSRIVGWLMDSRMTGHLATNAL